MANHHPNHFVVDGSNIATEGRSQPSLEQLNEAVLAFLNQYPGTTITVIVDATFGHRIDSKETKAFDEAVANNELVAPPAGAIGRGDAFVLAIADQAGAGVLSNDSFQEFHGQYEWLFDEGRLVGGKPVPNVGWVFVDRTPVRGPKSKASVRASRRSKVSTAELQSAKEQAASRVRKKGSQTVGENGSQSSESSKSGRSSRATASAQHSKIQKPTSDAGSGRSRRSGRGSASPKPSGGGYVNELLPFIEFVEHFPVGSTLAATVDRYSSHGAYLAAHDVSLYLPLQNIADPAPNSARSVLKLGDEVAVVVVRFQPDRRSIDVATPEQAPTVLPDTVTISPADELSNDGGPDGEVAAGLPAAPPETTAAKRRSAATTSADPKPAAKKTATRKSAATKSTAKRATAKRATAKRATAKKTGSEETAAKKSPAKKSAPKKSATKKSATPKSAATENTPTKESAAKKPAKQTPAKKAAAKKSPAKKTPAKKTPAKKSPAKKTPAKKSPAKKVSAKKSAASQTPAK